MHEHNTRAPTNAIISMVTASPWTRIDQLHINANYELNHVSSHSRASQVKLSRACQVTLLPRERSECSCLPAEPCISVASHVAISLHWQHKTSFALALRTLSCTITTRQHHNYPFQQQTRFTCSRRQPRDSSTIQRRQLARSSIHNCRHFSSSTSHGR